MKSCRAPVAKSNEHLFDVAMEALRNGQVARAKTAFHTLLKRVPNHLDGHFLLGTLYAESGDYLQAVRHLGRATELSPRSARVWQPGDDASPCRRETRGSISIFAGVGLRARHAGSGSQSCGLARHGRVVACFPGSGAPFPGSHGTGTVSPVARRNGFGAGRIRHAAEHEPANSSAAFHVAALEGRPMPRRPSGDVRELFDRYADIFDEHLVEHLGYRVPEQIASLLATLDGGQVRYRHALDIGCGTGLSGIAVRPRAERLSGVDVSPRMLAKARATGAYDEIAQQDLYEFLSAGDTRYDLIIAADVLIYIGALDELLAAIRHRADAGALLCLSVELNLGTEDYRVGAEDRYLHSRAYVYRVVASTGWSVLLEQEIPLRKSGEDKSCGVIVALRAGEAG